MGDRMLEVRIDRKIFGTEPVLRDIGFTIRAGEVVALLGPSGAGKTTLLRILLGLDSAFQGQVRRDHRRVGVVFQEPRLLPWLTVAENIRFVITGGMPPPDIQALLESVQLGHAGSLHPAQLSLGMARRAALARAMAISPDLLVLDEPFVSLDAQLATGLADAVAAYARSTGASVILATHDLAQAVQRVSRFLVLAGRPTTLCADRPAASTSPANLLRDFPFLRAENATAEALPLAAIPDYCHRNNNQRGECDASPA
jgi:NitT/TauT family transport system ATP-binding protein